MGCLIWDDAPKETQRQLNQLVSELLAQLGGGLLGIYLHGSLATGCFNPVRSDIDLLVVTRGPLADDTSKRLTETLLRLSAAPHPVEISVLSHADLHPWQHPTPFRLHYSEDWRERYLQALGSGSWQPAGIPATDRDLAAHVTVARRRGVKLAGKELPTVFPIVPRADFSDALLSDLRWAMAGNAGPEYCVLNACRLFAYLRDDLVLSKTEGAVWAAANLPVNFHPIIEQALQTQSSTGPAAIPLSAVEARRLCGFILDAAARLV